MRLALVSIGLCAAGLCAAGTGCDVGSPTPSPVLEPARAMAIADERLLAIPISDPSAIATDGAEIPRPDPPPGSSGSPQDDGGAPVLPSADAVAVGRGHACILSGGATLCWGDATHGALGPERACAAGVPDCALAPDLVAGLPAMSAIAAGNDVTCAIAAAAGEVDCWGLSAGGRLGGSVVAAQAPARPVALPRPAVAVRVQNDRACAIDDAGDAWCWGGDVGAVPVLQPLTGVVDLAWGAHHTCAISAAGVQCWGANRNGESGDAEAARACGAEDACEIGATTIPIAGAVRVVVGERHSCALAANGDVTCWGSNEVGQLGREDAWLVGEPAIAVRGAIDLVASYGRTCALLAADHRPWCWGDVLPGDDDPGDPLDAEAE